MSINLWVTELTSFCYVNFQVLNWMWRMLGSIQFCTKLISRLKNQLEKEHFFFSKWTTVNKKHETSLVYLTMNSDPSLCTLILQLTLKFWLIIRNAFLKHCTQNRKIKFNQNREHEVLKHIFNYCTCNKQFKGKGVINTFYIRF